MAFIAGGANVGGVMSAEQGVLKIQNGISTLSVAGGETVTVGFTIPAGKKWIIKSISTSGSNFVGTMARIRHQLYIDASHYANLTDNFGTGTSTLLNLPIPLTLSAGYKINFLVTTTAWTSGQIALSLIYQEIDA